MGRFSTITDTVPEPCRVAGTWLKPFCLGHHLLFKRLGIPLAIDALADADREAHVLPAVAICAGISYEWTLDRFLNGEWESAAKRLIDGLVPKFDRDSEATFRAYLTDGYSRPPVWRDPGGAVSFCAPWELILKCRLVEAGFTESEVLNGYLPARWYEYFTLVEFRQLAQFERLAAAGTLKPSSNFKKVFFTKEDADSLAPPEEQSQEETP